MDTLLPLLQFYLGRESRLDPPLTDQQWLDVIEQAKKQAVAGLVMDALTLLPEDQGPGREVIQEAGSYSVTILRKNAGVTEKCVKLCAFFKKYNIPCCVLKGQGAAAYYPRPELRQSGDIDLWIDADVPQLKAFAAEHKLPLREITYHHCDARFFKDVEVELHYKPSWSYRPSLDKKYQAWFQANKEAQFNNETNIGFPVPNTFFNLVYMMMHMYRHVFRESGLGLRQVMDYYYVLTSATDTEKTQALEDLKTLNLQRFAGAMMYVLQTVFRVDDASLLCQPEPVMGQYVLDLIDEGGNFGHYRKGFNKTHKTKLSSAIDNLIKNLAMLRFYPVEVLCFPFWKVWHLFWRLKYNAN